MSQRTSDLDPRVINDETSIPKWDAWDERVQKIVLGTLERERGEKKKRMRLRALPADFARRFPKLTHLYLWHVADLTELPPLPDGLQCLDVRGCDALRKIANLPAALETLVLEECPKLCGLPIPAAALASLADLSLRGCTALEEFTIKKLLEAAPGLRRFDASQCPQLTRIGMTAWPVALDRIDLNQCTGLSGLPSQWPPGLRRLGLRGASMLRRLDALPDAIDYLDLAGTKILNALPPKWGKPRTLFLHGSGVLMPPASEHGKHPEENVAARTRAYFEDVALVGRGEVKRCKLLLLGNGAAGKTCLAQRLKTKQPVTEEPDSTHGVQFWDLKEFPADVGGAVEPVHLHMWDFGGQEIYHNTHRLFMSKGSVFVVLWHPAQDGKQPPPGNDPFRYQDEWRPLQYWLDLIHLACPHRPRIAIVCSHHAQRTGALEKKWRKQVSENHRGYPSFYIDSWQREGEMAKLEEWLCTEVGGVIHAQGVAVPRHWEIAQELVESWLPEGGGKARFNNLSQVRFRQELAKVWREKSFALTDDRIRRTLGFLTHTGTVYWDPDLFKGRVIIGQQWALEGIYTLLQRKTEMFGRLSDRGGQFTRKDLDAWGWHGRFTVAEQKVLISFMLSVGLCFELVPESESWWREPVYKSFEHLWRASQLGLAERFDRSEGQPIVRSFEVPRLHSGHWRTLLMALGSRYGTDAEYARDGFYFENKEGQVVCLLVDIDPKKCLGGSILVQVSGPKAEERVKALESYVRRFVPGVEDSEPRGEVGRSEGNDAAGSRTHRPEVFFSYAWDPEKAEIPPGYEVPVDRIYEALLGEPIELLRDKKILRSGDDIVAFMQRGRKAAKFLLIHSDKYWRSPFCMYELSEVLDSFFDRAERLADVLVLVEHLNSGFQQSSTFAALRKEWKKLGSIPTMIAGVCPKQDLLQRVERIFKDLVPKMAALHDRNKVWSDGQAREVVAWVRERIGIEREAKSRTRKAR